MKSFESTNIDSSLPLEDLQAILQEYPVQFAILFGSYATGDTHQTSDIDIAVEFESLNQGDSSYNNTFFGLSADLSDRLQTDKIDLIDIQNVSPAVAKAILEDGIVLIGDQKQAKNTVTQKVSSSTETRSPRERFDTAIRKINEHLGHDSAVPATDRSRDNR